jgi:hypothetical protein
LKRGCGPARFEGQIDFLLAVRAMALYEQMASSDFAFSAPMALSRRDFLRIRELLVACIADVTAIVEPSDCETAAVLNIDFLQF